MPIEAAALPVAHARPDGLSALSHRQGLATDNAGWDAAVGVVAREPDVAIRQADAGPAAA